MSLKNRETYPDSFVQHRTVEIGGLNKSQLLQKLREHSISINELGEQLLRDDLFATSSIKFSVETVEITVADLGLFEGATLKKIFKRADALSLKLCPLELGPYPRIDYLDQPDKKDSKRFKAPKGSVTIASAVIKEDSNFPKGFYLRIINGELWLRGYTANDENIWDAEDHFIFVKNTF